MISNGGQEASHSSDNQRHVDLHVEIDHAADGNAASDRGVLHVQDIESASGGQRRDAERGDARGTDGGESVHDRFGLRAGRVGEQAVEARIVDEQEERADEREYVRVVDGRLFVALHALDVQQLGRGQAEHGAEQVNIDRTTHIVCLLIQVSQFSIKSLFSRVLVVVVVVVYLENVDVDVFVGDLRNDFDNRQDDELRESRFAQHGSERDQHSDGSEIGINKT